MSNSLDKSGHENKVDELRQDVNLQDEPSGVLKYLQNKFNTGEDEE